MLVSQSIYIQLQEIDYSEVISRYNDLKKTFMQQLSEAMDKTNSEINQDLFEQYVIQGIAEDLSSYDGSILVKELYDNIYQIVSGAVSGDAGLAKQRKIIRQQYTQSLKDKGKASKAKAEKAAIELGEQILSDEELVEMIKKQLSTKMQVQAGFDINDLLASLKGYRNKIIATKARKADSYIRSAKGYYTEALVYKAFERLSEHLDKQLSVLPTGGIKITNNQGAKIDTLYDTYIDFFNKLDANKFKTIVTENLRVGYGVQSKSWNSIPEHPDGLSYFAKKYGFSIGGRKELLERSGAYHGKNSVATMDDYLAIM